MGIRYTDEVVLSLVVSFLAPFRTNSIDSSRTAAVETATHEKTREQVSQEILAITLSAYMTQANPVTPQNISAFTKRWKAALASQNITDLISAPAWSNLTALASVFTKIVSGKPELRVEIVNKMLELPKRQVQGVQCCPR